MANITRRRNSDRTTSYVALVRIKPFAPISKSFGDRPAAVQWADAMEGGLREQRDRGGLRSDVTQLSVADLIREFERDPVNSTRKSARDTVALLTWWLDHYGTVRALELNVLALRAARERLAAGGARRVKDAHGNLVVAKRSASTVNRHLSAMRACWNWSRRSGLIPASNLWPTGLQLAEPRGRARFLSDAELARLMRAATVAGPAMHAAIVLSICTGLRQGELLRLVWSDIDLDYGSLRVLEAKNGEARAVHLAAPAVAALRTLRAQPLVGIGRVFVLPDGTELDKSLLTSRWKAIRRNAGLADTRWHDLRHCAASYLLQAGATLSEVGAVLGHKSPSVTARYAHLIVGKPLAAHAGLTAKLNAALGAAQSGESQS